MKPATTVKIEVDKAEPEASSNPAAQPVSDLDSRQWVGHSFSTPGKDVHVIMPSDIAKHYGDPSQSETRSLSKVMENVEGDVKWLLELINQNDQKATKTLVEIGIFVATCVENVATHNINIHARPAVTRPDIALNTPAEPDRTHLPQNQEQST